MHVTGLGSFGRMSLNHSQHRTEYISGLNWVIAACRLGRVGKLETHLTLGETEAQNRTCWLKAPQWKPGAFGLALTPQEPQWTWLSWRRRGPPPPRTRGNCRISVSAGTWDPGMGVQNEEGRGVLMGGPRAEQPDRALRDAW